MVLFHMASGAEPIPTVFVGDSISCDCGGVEGRWSLNGVDINVTASQIQDTISVVNGSFNYDGRLDCDSGGNPCEFKALGESRCVYLMHTIEGLVSVERWSCSRVALCVVEYTMGRLRDWSLWRGSLLADMLHVWWSKL